MGHFYPNFGPKASGLCSQNSLLLFLKFTRTMERSEKTKVAILNILKKNPIGTRMHFFTTQIGQKKRKKRSINPSIINHPILQWSLILIIFLV